MYLRSLLFCCMAALLMGCQTSSRASGTGPAGPAPTAAPTEAPTAAPSPAAAPTADKPIDLALRVEALTAKGPPKFIDSDESLRSGDRLALHVEVSEPSYVYVGHRAPNGKRSVIFPRSGNELFAPGMDHRIPAAGQWFKLDRDSGQEDLFLYASRKALTSDETLKLLESDSARWKRTEPRAPAKTVSKNKPGATQPSQPEDGMPGKLEPGNRGLIIDESADIEADKDLTKAHFLIRHRK